jgi:hypothetical protein
MGPSAGVGHAGALQTTAPTSEYKLASKKEPFETQTVRTERKAARLVKQGWEIVSSTSWGTWITGKRTVVILRRPNPKYKS